MKPRLLLAVVTLLGLVLAFAYGQTSRSTTEPQPGRYQLVIANSSTGSDPQVYKIDTATGKTWALAFTLPKDGGMMFGVIKDAPDPKH
jgi:hypothetical protein